MARKPKKHLETEAAIGKADIKRSALEAWRKLDAVIQDELTAVQNGQKELNASTATAIVKYIEASMSLATGSEDVSEKDRADRSKAMFANLTLPTFDDENFNTYDNNKNTKGN
jgi:hypothetical protein